MLILSVIVEYYEGTNTKKYHEHVPCSYVYKVVCTDDKYSQSIVVYSGVNAAYEFIKSILLKSVSIVKK